MDTSILKTNEVLITDLTHEGYGVGKVDGYPLFIPGAMVGEIVKYEVEKMNKSYGTAKLIEIVKPSPHRVKPRCNIFGVCGGCDLMHMSYQQQLAFKVKMAEDSFRKLGHLNLSVDEIIGMDEPYYYRNKVQIPFGMRKNKVICGYYKKKSHEIASFDYCYIQPEYITELITFIRNLANEYKISAYDEKEHQGVLRHVLVRNNYLHEMMIVFITNTDNIPNINEIINKIIKRYPQVKSIIHNINNKKTNVILGDKYHVLYGNDYLIDKIHDLQFKISFYSFFQVNLTQTEKLYQRVLNYLKPASNDIIIDGYCGVGTITLMIAKYCKQIYGIEVVNEAIENAKENAKLNNINNATFIVGKVEDEIGNLINNKISAIVLDPPRKGVEKVVIEKIIENNIHKIVYVSCNVATLARDLSLLASDYDIKNVTLVDMFCHTADVEAVALLERK